MWQIEDIIRANGLNIDRIDKNVIDRYSLDPIQRKKLRDWYESLIDMMRRENIEKSGHLQINKNIMIHLVDLHLTLLKNPKFANYTAEFYKTLPIIVELRSKSGEAPAGEIETCFNALYGMFIMRLQSKKISEGTSTAVQQISRFIAMLVHYCKLDDEDRLFNEDTTDVTSTDASLK